MKEISKMSLEELLLHSHKHFLEDRITNSDYELQILSRFNNLTEKVKELEGENSALKETLKAFHLDMEGWEWKEE